MVRANRLTYENAVYGTKLTNMQLRGTFTNDRLQVESLTATAGKGTQKKDLGMLAQAYGNVYVAQLAIGANQQQTVRAMLEAQAWPGPSLLIAYSTCIAHGIDMATSMTHQAEAVASGYWPLYRYRPGDGQPLHLDSKAPTLPVADFMASEAA